MVRCRSVDWIEAAGPIKSRTTPYSSSSNLLVGSLCSPAKDTYELLIRAGEKTD
jgi:hypothetical protein